MRWIPLCALLLLSGCQNDCDHARDQAGDAWATYVKRVRAQESALLEEAAAAARVERKLLEAGRKRGHRALSEARRTRTSNRNKARQLARWGNDADKIAGLVRRGWWGGAIPDGKKLMKKDASAGIPHRATEAALEACKPQ